MSFPAPNLTPPTLNPWQMSHKGLVFGGFDLTTPYLFQQMPLGLDVPAYITGDIQRALDQGEFSGIDLSPGRDIQYTQLVKTDGTSVAHARRALAGVMVPAGVTSHPLYLRTDDNLIFGCMARPRKHQYVSDLTLVQAKGVVMASQWHATDPRWYTCPTKTATVGLTSSGSLGGLLFNATAPFTFGGGTYAGVLSVYNAGHMEMRPVLIITGPCTNPVVSNLSLPGDPFIGVNITLGVGDTLTIDTDFQSILYTAAGTSVGQSRGDDKMDGTTWWNLLPSQFSGGLNTIAFTTGDAAFVTGTLTVQSADAWIGL